MVDDQKEFYNVSDVAEKLGVSPSHINNQVKANLLPHIRIGRTVRFPCQQFDDYLAAAWQNSLDTLTSAGTSTSQTDETDGAASFQRALKTT